MTQRERARLAAFNVAVVFVVGASLWWDRGHHVVAAIFAIIGVMAAVDTRSKL